MPTMETRFIPMLQSSTCISQTTFYRTQIDAWLDSLKELNCSNICSLLDTEDMSNSVTLQALFKVSRQM